MDNEQFIRDFPENTEIGRDVTETEVVSYRDNGRNVGVWRENRRTTTRQTEILKPDDAAAARHYCAQKRQAMQPQDAASGLVERIWTRTSRRRGELTERTLVGEQVTASFLSPQGRLEHVKGKVIRNAAGELVIESWADGIRKETAVTCEASVDVKGGPHR